MNSEQETDIPDTEHDEPYSPLSRPWCHFPTGAKVPAMVAESLYHTAMGISGVARLLHQSNRLRDNLAIYEDQTDFPLKPYDEGCLWSALIALGDHFTCVVEEMAERARAEDAVSNDV